MLEDITRELRKRLKEAVEKNPAEGLLFSGGLDSGILAYLCPDIKAITVTLNSWGEDLKYARFLAKSLGLKHHHRSISTREAIDAVPEIIKVLKSFDPVIPNDITVYLGLKFARDLGIESVMTGDGSDELLAGYSFMEKIPHLEDYIRRISQSMFFSSNVLGDFLDIKIEQPYLNKEFIDFCLGIPLTFKLKQVKEEFIGKWVLRKAFEDVLSEDIVWQDKRPLEYGSGTTKLREIISSRVSDDEFKQGKDIYPVKFISKEHFYYYKIYRKEVGLIPVPLPGERACPGCGAGLREEVRHCRICGWAEKL